MKKKKMQLYVWNGFCPDYASGLAVAIAESEMKARNLIRGAMQHEPFEWGKLTVQELNKPFCDWVYGGG